MDKLIEQLNSSKKPILVNNILPSQENKNIMHILSLQDSWYFGFEGDTDYSSRVKIACTNGYPHMGMMLKSASEGHKDFNNSPLNIYGKLIANIVFERLKFNYNNILRLWWNYYFKGQEGVGHVDMQTKKNISLVYSIMPTDGGTEILNQFYPDVEGQAKIFKSDWLHRGVTTKQDKSRLILNMVFE